MSTDKNTNAPGLTLTATIAALAFYIHQLPFPPFTIGERHPIDALLIAIVIGMLIRNLTTLGSTMSSTMDSVLKPGVDYSVKTVLPFAIVLMGAKLNFNDIMEVSSQALLISVICVAAALILTLWLCHRLGVGQKLGLLIGIGTAICGGTAIAVAAPTIEADDHDTAFAITTITIFGVLAIFVFPLLGHALSMTEVEFGVWAGISIQATPQVMAAGFAYGERAGEVAVIVKLVRVLLLAPLVIILGAWHARKRDEEQGASGHDAPVIERTSWTQLVPPFIIGFLILAIAQSMHLLPDLTLHFHASRFWSAGDVSLSMTKVVTKCSLFLITMAMAGVGLGVHFKTLKRVGLRALYIGMFSALVLSVFGYGLMKALL